MGIEELRILKITASNKCTGKILPEMDTTLGNHLPPFLVPQVKFMEQQNETPRNA